MTWMQLWKFILILTLSSYSLLVIIVTIGGTKNLIQMLKELKEPLDQTEE
ncbi:MAG: hypothetical protein MUP98_17095 [Candidatus Aminicenantes bacterium]|nr:hypothetical protein [Candidatus Aminicenantes bacterium]